MTSPFKESTRHWLRIQPELIAAKERFRDEFHLMLSRVETRFSQAGWKTNLSEACLHVYRPSWQTGWRGIHYEVVSFGDYFRKGIVHLGLHVEEETPDAEAVRERLRQLVEPYEEQLLSRFGCQVLPEGHRHVFESSLQLVDASEEAIGDALERMASTESFVEEAWYLADKTPVWRCDFVSNDVSPVIDWTEWSGKKGGQGGWSTSDKDGRLGTACLDCSPETTNYGNRGNRLVIHDSEGQPFRSFAVGQTTYCCAVVRAPSGGEIDFTLQTTRKGKYKRLFDQTLLLDEAEGWQVVWFEGETEEVSDYDPVADGLYAYLLIDEHTETISIDSIEIGPCPAE